MMADWLVEQHQLQTLQAAAESWDRCQQARAALAERARPRVAIERDSRISHLRSMRELGFEIDPPKT